MRSDHRPNMPDHNSNLFEYIKTKWGTESPSSVVAKIGTGDRLATEAFGLSPNTKYRSQVAQAGAIDKLLGFLIKTDKPFRDVLIPSTTTAQISCPSTWLNLLNNFCQDGFLTPESLARDVQYKIIINLGPLFQDMSNLEQRKLFGDRDMWIKSLMFFCNILSNLLSSNFDRIGDFLLKQKALQSFLVRALFLPLGEPNIAREIQEFSEKREDRVPKPDILGTSSTFAACAIKALWTKRGGKNPDLIENWAATPIAPDHPLRLMTGLLQLLQWKTHGNGWYKGGYSAALTIFLILFDKAERLSGPFGVDSVSEVLVGICRQHLIQYAPLSRDRFLVENVLTGMVATGAALMTPLVNGKQAPVDYSVAKAIRAGLFDFLIESCDTNDSRLANMIEGSIRTAKVCLVLDETQKALQELAPSIRAKVERIQDRHPVLLPPLQHIHELLDNPLVKAPPVAKTCAFCQDALPPPQNIQKCPFCKTIVYCSKECRHLNWMIHQMECPGKRKEPVAQTPEQLLADGKRFFTLHISKMLLQASLKGYSILDCIVVIDMCEFTPLLKTYTLEQFCSTYVQDQDAVGMSEKVLQRNKNKGALTVSFVGFSNTDGLNGNLMTFPPDTVPDLPGMKQVADAQKWPNAQKLVTQASLGPSAAGQMQKNPRVWQATLMTTMKP